MTNHRERLTRDFAAWIATTSLREIELLVGLIAAELLRRALPGARALDDARRTIEQCRLRTGEK